MTRDITFWRRINKAVDPFFEIRPDKISALYNPRRDAPTASLENKLKLAEFPTEIRAILSGSRGSGKSTELTRLSVALKDTFVPITLDLGAALPSGVSSLPITVLIAAAGLKILHEWTRPNTPFDSTTGDSEIAKKLTSAVAKFSKALILGPLVSAVGSVMSYIPEPHVQALAPVVQSAGATMGVVQKALPAPRSQTAVPTLHMLGSGGLAARISPEQMNDARALVDATNAILAEIEDTACRPVLILAEGLDKLHSLADARAAISQSEVLDPLRAAIIFTGPVSLRHSIYGNWLPGKLEQHILANRPIFSRKGGVLTRRQEAIDELVRIYRLRADYFAVPDDLFVHSDLESIAEKSSGIVREFLTLLRGAVAHAYEHGLVSVRTESVEYSLRRRRLDLQYALNERREKVLRRVLLTSKLPEGDEPEELLFQNFIACYENGDLFFRPHELLVPGLEGPVPGGDDGSNE